MTEKLARFKNTSEKNIYIETTIHHQQTSSSSSSRQITNKKQNKKKTQHSNVTNKILISDKHKTPLTLVVYLADTTESQSMSSSTDQLDR